MNPEADRKTRPEHPAAAGELAAFLLSASHDQLVPLLDHGDLDDTHLCLLLARRDLSGELLERISRRREWLQSRRVCCELVAHPHTPRRVAIRLARELYIMDLAAISFRPSAPAEIRRFAGEMLLGRISQLALGQKLVVARRGPARVAGALLADGNERVVRAALDNPFLTEAQILRALGDESLPSVAVGLIARHAKWSFQPTVRAALTRHPHAALADVFGFLAGLPRRDLIALGRSPRLRSEVRSAVARELQARTE